MIPCRTRTIISRKKIQRSTNVIEIINHALKKNRNILESLIPKEGLQKKPRRINCSIGFQFKIFHSQVTQTKKEVTSITRVQLVIQYLFCYGIFGYLKLGGRWFFVVKRKELKSPIY